MGQRMHDRDAMPGASDGSGSSRGDVRVFAGLGDALERASEMPTRADMAKAVRGRLRRRTNRRVGMSVAGVAVLACAVMLPLGVFGGDGRDDVPLVPVVEQPAPVVAEAARETAKHDSVEVAAPKIPEPIEQPAQPATLGMADFVPLSAEAVRVEMMALVKSLQLKSLVARRTSGGVVDFAAHAASPSAGDKAPSAAIRETLTQLFYGYDFASVEVRDGEIRNLSLLVMPKRPYSISRALNR